MATPEETVKRWMAPCPKCGGESRISSGGSTIKGPMKTKVLWECGFCKGRGSVEVERARSIRADLGEEGEE